MTNDNEQAEQDDHQLAAEYAAAAAAEATDPTDNPEQ